MSEIYSTKDYDGDSLSVWSNTSSTIVVKSSLPYPILTFDQATTMCSAILAHINEQNALRAAEVAKENWIAEKIKREPERMARYFAAQEQR